MATVAFAAQNETITAAYVTHAALRRRQPFDELLQLAGLVKLPDFLHSTDVPAADENPRQSQLALTTAAEDSL